MMKRSQEKSQFLHQQKEAWDYLVTKTAMLQAREVEARQDAEVAERAFTALSEKSRVDEEKATQVVKERDELLREGGHSCQFILDLLADAKRERDVKLASEERAAGWCRLDRRRP
jgi:signal transduction histidine kinase